MASASQIEAFAWWLAQTKESRTAVKISERFNVPIDTAEKWRTAFGRQLAKVAGETVETHLRQFRAEYEVIQSRTLGALPLLVDAIEANARLFAQMAENGEPVNVKALSGTASALKAVYSLAESASGADVAKKRAAQKPASARNPDALPALPDLGALFTLVESVEIEDESGEGVGAAVDSKGAGNETGNENPARGPESSAE